MTGRIEPYEYLADDISLAKVALRFRTTAEAIWLVTQEQGKFKGMPMSALAPGDIVFVPLPDIAKDPDEIYQWETVTPEAITVKAFCEDFNKKVAAPKLDPVALWFNIRNAAFRARHIKKGELGPDTAKFDIKDKSDSIKIPVQKTSTPTVAVPPSTGSTPNVAVIKKKPEWKRDIEDAIDRIQNLTMDLHNLNVLDTNLLRDCAKDCSILNALRAYTNLLLDTCTTIPAQSSLKEVKRKLGFVDAYAGEHMLVNPGRLIFGTTATLEKKNAAQALLDATKEAKLYAAALKLQKEPDTGLIIPLSNMLTDAYEVLMNSYVASAAGKEVEDALARVPTHSGKYLKDTPTTMAILAQLGTAVATGASGVTAWNMIITLMTLRAIQCAPETVGSPALAQAVRYKYLDILSARPKVSDAKNLSEEEIYDLSKTIESGDVGNLKIWEESLVGRYGTVGAKEFGTGIAFSVCGFLALLYTIETASDEKNQLRLWANLAGGAATMEPGLARVTLGALKLLNASKYAARFESAMGGEVSSAVGVFGAVCGLISGSISAVEAYEADDVPNLIIDIMQIESGVVTILGAFCENAALAAEFGLVGMLVGIGAAAGSGLVLLADKMRKGTERVFSARLQQFKSSNNVHPFLSDVDGFQAALDDLIDYVKNEATFEDLAPTIANRRRVKKLGFTDDEVEFSVGEK